MHHVEITGLAIGAVLLGLVSLYRKMDPPDPHLTVLYCADADSHIARGDIAAATCALTSVTESGSRSTIGPWMGVLQIVGMCLVLACSLALS